MKDILTGELTTLVEMPRHYRSRRSSMPRQVIQSYKKVLNFAPVSQAAGSRNIIYATGVDSVAAGQTSAIDSDVPTGCIIKFVTIQISLGQIVGGAVFAHMSIQRLGNSQPAVPSNTVGGSPQRNQVFRQFMKQLGINQNYNQTITFKVPPKFQRVREGDNWLLEITTSNTLTQAFQVIYKFYR